MFKKIRGSLFYSICLIGVVYAFSAYSQVSEPYNRIQYRQYSWKFLSTPAFRLYFPAGYDSLAQFAAAHYPDLQEETGKAMGAFIGKMPHIVIYPAITASYETNIGKETLIPQSFPTISLKGSRLVVAFNGSYLNFRNQLKEALIRVTWEETLEKDLEKQVGTGGSVPEWYKEGCIRFFSERWPLEKEEALQTIFNRDQPEGWDELSQSHPGLSGQAFCYFLSLTFRYDAAKQVFFQMRGGKSLSRSVRLVTKRNLDSLKSDCFNFYQARFASQEEGKKLPASLVKLIRVAHPKEDIWHVLKSNDRKNLMYITQRDNVRKLYIVPATMEFSRKQLVFSYAMPPWIKDNAQDHYPFVEWSANSDFLYVISPEKGNIKVRRIGIKGREQAVNKLYGVDGLRSFRAVRPDQWLFSAYRKGQSDIVLYNPVRLRYQALTDDLADGLEPFLYMGEAGMKMAYRSGFPADSLLYRDSLAKPYGIYLKDVSRSGAGLPAAEELLLQADSGYISWHDPLVLDGSSTALTGTRPGARHADTFAITAEGIEKITVSKPVYSAWLGEYQEYIGKRDSLNALEEQLKAEEENTSFFAGVLLLDDTASLPAQRKDSLRRVLAYSPRKVKLYALQLHSAYFSAAINNDYYINRYQPFGSYLGTFKFPETGAMLSGGLSDLFENHHFNMGYRMPASAEGSDFFFRYENTAKRTDWHFLYFRKVENLQPDPARDWRDEKGSLYPFAAKVKTHYYESGFHFPLHYSSSLRFTIAARNDRTVFLATDRYSLRHADLEQWWNINSLSLSINKKYLLPIAFLQRGWSAGASVDGMAALKKPSTFVYGLQLQSELHQPLLQGINMVVRLSGGRSGGRESILYNFGGTDHNIVPRVDTAVRFVQDAGYAFQTLITPFRGHMQNSLYGSYFGLLNLDLYFPLFATLIPLRSPFPSLNHLQLGLFSDFALAGERATSHYRELRHAYGLSVRTLLAGYALRFDLAWPGNFSHKPVWYLSLKF